MSLAMRPIQMVIRLADRCAEAEQASASQAVSQRSQELRQYMETLDHDVILDIQALMWLGRDCRYWRKKPHRGQFEEYRARAARSYPAAAGKEDAIDSITEKGPLSDYLREALNYIKL